MRLLVTGAAGFIGSSVADRLLATGQSVIGLDNFCDFYDPAAKRANIEKAMADSRFELIEADIRDRSAVLDAFARYQPQAVVHLAAILDPDKAPERARRVNVDATLGLIAQMEASGTARSLDRLRMWITAASGPTSRRSASRLAAATAVSSGANVVSSVNWLRMLDWFTSCWRASRIRSRA